MPEEKTPRADKFLWSVRVFKTRALAGEACSKGRISIHGVQVKPSRTIKTGDIIEVRKTPVNYTYKVLGFPGGRVSAKLVPDYLINLTPPGELLKLELTDSFFVKRDPRSGRPTKKERRLIDKLGED